MYAHTQIYMFIHTHHYLYPNTYAKHMNAEKFEGKTEWTHWKYKATQQKSAGITHFTSLNRSLSIPSYKFSFGFTTGYVQNIWTFILTSFMFPVSTSTVTKKTWLMNFWPLKFQRKTGSFVSRSVLWWVDKNFTVMLTDGKKWILTWH